MPRPAILPTIWLILLGAGGAAAQDATNTSAPPPDGVALTSRATALADELEARAGVAETRADEVARLAEMVEQMMAILGDSRSASSARQQIIADLSAELATARAEREGAETNLSSTQAERDQLAGALAAARASEEQLEQQEATLHAALDELESREGRIAELTTSLDAERVARDEMAALSEELDGLRLHVGELAQALQSTRAEVAAKSATIGDLERALSNSGVLKAAELDRYRATFLAKMRQVSGDRRDVRVVGERFVLQSEVLFDVGSATLGEDGRVQMTRLAEVMLDIAATIPADVAWVLRVDGHTDRRPIATDPFPSNWELSSDRAISVVRFLAEQGVAPDRLVAAGFAEYQPLDTRDDEIAYRRNRRIEITLTQR